MMKKAVFTAMMVMCVGAAAMTGCSSGIVAKAEKESAAVRTEAAAVQKSADLSGGTKTVASTVTIVDTASDEQELICGVDESTWSPITDCESLAEAEGVAGIEIHVPEKIEDYENISYSAMPRYQLVQVEYHKDEQHYICIRKAPGTEDISGDYNIYTEETTAEIDGRQVILKGNDGKAALALWTDGDYSYSVMAADLTETPASNGAGMSVEQMKTLVSAVA